MPSRRATITRRPLASFISLGAAIASGRGAAGGGGVVYGWRGRGRAGERERERGAAEQRALCEAAGRQAHFLRDLFLAIVDRHLVRAEHVLAHDALHVGGGDALQLVEVGVDACRVALEHRGLGDRRGEAERRLARHAAPG